MPKNLQPLDDSSTKAQSLPDRSALSELYGKPLEDISKSPQTNKKIDKTIDPKTDLVSHKPIWKLAVIANFLLAVPFIMSYLSISKIYTLEGPDNISDAAANQLIMSALTISTFLPWIVSLRYLSKVSSSYSTNLLSFLLLYCFFAFPALDIMINLRPHMPILVLLLIVIILSQAYVRIMVHTLLTSKTGFSRYWLLVIAILVTCLAAIVL